MVPWASGCKAGDLLPLRSGFRSDRPSSWQRGKKLWQLCRDTATGVGNVVMSEHGWEQTLDGCTLTLLLSGVSQAAQHGLEILIMSARLSDLTKNNFEEIAIAHYVAKVVIFLHFSCTFPKLCCCLGKLTR